MKKEDIYLNMKKLTESQRREVMKLLPGKFNSMDYDVRYYFEFLQYKDNEWVFSVKPDFKTEIDINQFRELFQDDKSNGLELNYIVIDDEIKTNKETKQLKKEDVFLDLAKLTRGQLSNIEKVLKINNELVYKTDRKLSKKGFDEINKYPCLAFDDDDNEWMCFSRNPFGSIFNTRGNKTEISYDEFINLFQSKEVEVKKKCQSKEEIKLNLKVGDTFEYEGFICEVKEKVYNENWYKIITNKQVSYKKKTKQFIDKLSDYPNVKTELITDYRFINLLEKNNK